MSTIQSSSSLPSRSALSRLANWWFKITTPTHSSQPQWREELASFIMPIVLLTVVVPFPSAVGNISQLITLTVVLVVNILALFLKKAGHFRLAGILIVVAIEFGLAIAIITWPGLDAAQLPLFALLAQIGLVVIAFFSPPMILYTTIINCAFILVAPHFLHLTPAFQGQLALNGPAIYTPMIELQLFISSVAGIIMSILIRAIQRADTAEKLAELEALEIKRQEEQMLIGKQIEEGVQQILTTLNNVVSQNDFSMRVPLKQENILWRVGRSINNLLARLQGLKQDQEELKRTHAVAAEIAQHIQQGVPIKLESWTGTAFDPVIIEYNKRFQKEPGPLAKSKLTPDRTIS